MNYVAGYQDTESLVECLPINPDSIIYGLLNEFLTGHEAITCMKLKNLS